MTHMCKMLKITDFKSEIKKSYLQERLNAAADEIDNLFWFGLAEKPTESLEMLKWQLGIKPEVTFKEVAIPAEIISPSALASERKKVK